VVVVAAGGGIADAILRAFETGFACVALRAVQLCLLVAAEDMSAGGHRGDADDRFVHKIA